MIGIGCLTETTTCLVAKPLVYMYLKSEKGYIFHKSKSPPVNYTLFLLQEDDSVHGNSLWFAEVDKSHDLCDEVCKSSV